MSICASAHVQNLDNSVNQLSTQLASSDLRARTGAQPVFVTPLPTGKLNFHTAVMTEAAPTVNPAPAKSLMAHEFARSRSYQEQD